MNALLFSEEEKASGNAQNNIPDERGAFPLWNKRIIKQEISHQKRKSMGQHNA